MAVIYTNLAHFSGRGLAELTWTTLGAGISDGAAVAAAAVEETALNTRLA